MQPEKSTTKSRSDIPPYKPPHYWARRDGKHWTVVSELGPLYTERQARAVAQLLNDMDNQEWP